MPLLAAQPTESVGGAQPVQRLCRFPPAEVRILATGILVEQDPEGLCAEGVRIRLRRRGSHRSQRPVVRLLDDILEDKPVAMSLHGSDEYRVARIVIQRASEDPGRLAQGTVGDNHVTPH